ncbi:hypothetical protein L4Z68_001414 [Pseudomonas aeruginosa]|nr:hypothetical protein [Pseudomonas aeruginosa]EKX2969421.1 hypothetical protein [Pseudomonas aeruginosa]HBO8004210.1 hypothetical protein [Pseudomonas aeruginosa]HDV6123100.1 hypothetical protein [Pseudomonas aeruginosa]HDV6143978.1 hypothetical protein [Pseudomonas aeruginosa]
MPTFRIVGKVTVSCWTTVEAASEEEAQRIAAGRDLAEFHIDGTYPEDESWHLDADGVPYDLRVDN